MTRKSHMDATGAMMLTGFAALFAFNQVVIKVTGGGFGPIFMAGLRSLGAVCVILLWMRWRGISVATPRAAWWGGAVIGLLFSAEFMAIYTALDITSVARASIMLYSMPIWLALAGHVLLPEDRLTGARLIGFVLAMAGVILALADRAGGTASLWGDLLGVFAAMCWAGIALTVRLTPLRALRPEVQLLWQLAISAPLLLGTGLLSADTIRAVAPIHIWGMAFQILCIASFGFLLWFWLLARYPASGVASFSFLSPVLAVLFSWMILGEVIGPTIWFALGLVAAGLILINRRSAAPPRGQSTPVSS